MRDLPNLTDLPEIRERPGLRLSFAGTAFLYRFQEALAPMGLTPSRLLALAYIRVTGGTDQSSLARMMGINRASSMQIVDRFAELGFVERRAGKDKRSHNVVLTRSGERAYQKAMRLERSVSRALFRNTKADEIFTFLAQCDAIVARATTWPNRDRQG